MSERPFAYNIRAYGGMVSCEPRIRAYVDALSRFVRPGSTVFDIGAGPGVFALVACQLGAKKVVAIEPDSSIQLAQRMAAENGFADRLEVRQVLSTDFQPEVLADVIVSDMRGNLPFLQCHVAAIADARQRLLATGGTLIPQADNVFVCAVERPDMHALLAKPWIDNRLGLDLSAGFEFTSNTVDKVYLETDDLLGPPAHLGTLDYRQISDPNFAADFNLEISRSGTIHGFALWFDAELAEDIGFSNAPGADRLIYGQVFLPIASPLEVKAGGSIRGRFIASLVSSEYVYAWSGEISPAPGEAPVPFDQTTFRSRIYSQSDLATSSVERVPRAGQRVAVDAFILGQVDGLRSVEEIARASSAKFEACLPTREAAIDRVQSLLARYRK